MTDTSKYNFQYCPKLVIFNDNNEVLLCKRQWEEDFDWVFSFPWWKRESIDTSIEEWIKREKNEEIWDNIKIKVYRKFNIEEEYVKKSWSCMILPHYAWIYEWWEVKLNEEYSEYKWVSIEEMKDTSVINTIEPTSSLFLNFKESQFFKNTKDSDFFYI